jgi:hypothetical protein
LLEREVRRKKREEKAQLESLKLGARQAPLPVVLSSPGILPVPECPTRMVCPILLTNPLVPIISIYAEIQISNGVLVPGDEAQFR